MNTSMKMAIVATTLTAALMSGTANANERPEHPTPVDPCMGHSCDDNNGGGTPDIRNDIDIRNRNDIDVTATGGAAEQEQEQEQEEQRQGQEQTANSSSESNSSATGGNANSNASNGDQSNSQSTTYSNSVKYPASSAIAHAANVYQAGQCNQADSAGAAAQGASFGFSLSFGGAEVNGVPVQYEDTLRDKNGEAVLDSDGNEQIVKKPLVPFLYFHDATTNEMRAKMDAAVPSKYLDTWQCGLNDTAGVILQMKSTETITIKQVEGNTEVANIYANASRDVATIQKEAQLESIDRQAKADIMVKAFTHELNEMPNNPAGNRDHEHVVETVVNYGLQTMFKLESHPIVAPEGSSYTRFNPVVVEEHKVIEPK